MLKFPHIVTAVSKEVAVLVNSINYSKYSFDGLQESDGADSVTGAGAGSGGGGPPVLGRHNSLSSEDSHSHASVATSEAEFGQVEHDFSSINYRKLTKVSIKYLQTLVAVCHMLIVNFIANSSASLFQENLKDIMRTLIFFH